MAHLDGTCTGSHACLPFLLPPLSLNQARIQEAAAELHLRIPVSPLPAPPPALSSLPSYHVPHQARIQEAAAELHLRIPDTSGLGFIQSPRSAATSKAAAAEKARIAAAAEAEAAKMEAAGWDDEDDASALMHDEEGEEDEEGSEA